MDDQVIGFDDAGVRNIVRVVNRVNGMPFGDVGEPWHDTGNDGNFDDWVQVTDGTPDGDGWYEAILQTYDEATDTWSDVTGSECFIRGANDETLAVDTRYRGNIQSIHTAKTGYQTMPGGAGASLTVKEVDDLPTVTGVTTLNFDQVDGFRITDSGSGVALIEIAPASASAIGVVDLSAQVMGRGEKSFDTVRVISGADGSVSSLDTLIETLSGSCIIRYPGTNTNNALSLLMLDYGTGQTFNIDTNYKVTSGGWVWAGHKFRIGSSSSSFDGTGTSAAPVTFTTADGKTVTVRGGIITSVV